MKIGIIGAGNVGQKLGGLIKNGGHEIVFGTQNPANRNVEGSEVLSIQEAIDFADIVIFAIPFTAYNSLLPKLKDSLSGKIVIDVTNPLNEDWSPLLLGAEDSGGEMVVRMLPDSRVVKAFNTIFADIMTPEGLNRNGHKVTAFIAGNDEQAVEAVRGLAVDMGCAPVVAGSIKNARYFEAIAHLNIQLAVVQGGGTNAAFVYFQG